ncbi:MAG TPA: PorT family protein [bacterium]|nr:PorT family protein [bacterium]
MRCAISIHHTFDYSEIIPWRKRMRRKALIIGCLVMLLSAAAMGQGRLVKGIKVGQNLAMLSGSDLPSNIEHRTALTGGIAIEINILTLLHIEMDLLYSPQGLKIINGEEWRLNYFSLPVVMKKKFLPLGIHPYLLAGLEFNYLLSAKYGDENIKDDIVRQDMCVLIGGGIEFSIFGKGVHAEGRYKMGLDSIYENAEKGAYHRVTQVLFGFLI